jgi:dienelactone hydrolase
MRRTGRLAGALLALLAGPAAAAPVDTLADGRIGAIEFATVTPAGPTQFVQRRAPAASAMGNLALPEGTGPFPAVVLAHGSGGVSAGREGAWAARLNRLGIATFVVDSFGPRGIASTASDQGRLSTMVNVADALTALRLLATHPLLDPARIAVMGFSRGGQVALYSALEPLRRAVLDGELRFAAHVALYPSCSIPYRAQRVGAAPILMLLGGADDYTPAAQCHVYADWFRGRGAPVRVVEYAGAHHGFDTPVPPRRLDSVQTAADCRAEVTVGEAATMRRLDTGQALSAGEVGAYLRGCSRRGATFGGDPAALAAAEADVAAFLAEVFQLPR